MQHTPCGDSAPGLRFYHIVGHALLYLLCLMLAAFSVAGCSGNPTTSVQGAGWDTEPEPRADDRAERGSAREVGHFTMPEDNLVACIGFFPDGRRVIVGTTEGSLWVLDFGTDKGFQRVKVTSDALLTGGILSLAVSPDGSRVLTGCADNTVRLVDLATGKLIHVLKGHGGPVWSVAFMKDGHHALSGSTNDYTIRLWDLNEGKQLRQMRGRDRVNNLAISPDQKTVAAPEFMAISLWDIATGERIRVLEGHGSRVAGIAYSPDGRSIVSAAIDTVKTWDSTTGKMVNRCGFDYYVAHFALSPDGRWALLGGHNGMMLMDIEKCEELQRWEKLDGDVVVAFSPDGRYAVSGEQWGGVRVWDLPKVFEKPATP